MNKKFAIPFALLVAALLAFGLWLIPEKSFSEEEGVFALEEQAQTFLREEKWDAAAETYKKLTTLNPYNGTYFLYQGYSLVIADRCPEAVPVFETALHLSGNTGVVAFHASRCALRLEQMENFERLLKLALANGVTDFSRLEQETAFDVALQDDEIRKVLSLPSLAGLSRDQKWAYDLETYKTLLLTIHPDPFHTTPRDQWFMGYQELMDTIPALNDLEIIGGIMRLSALVGDGHTSVYPPESFHLLPIYPYRFKDGFYVKAAAPGFEHLVGRKIISAGGLPIADVAEKSHVFMASDNPMTKIWFEEALLQIIEGYYLAGASKNPNAETLSFVFEDENGNLETLEIPANAPGRNPLARQLPEGWSSMPGDITKPLWLKNLEKDFWFEDIPDTNVIYAQINQVTNGNQGDFAELSEKLLTAIAEENPGALILDLRMNNGGNSTLTNRLVTGLAASSVNQPGKLFVITGRRTFSAAGLLAAYLERYTEALFVGEPMSAKPNIYGDDNYYTLPYSGLSGSISSTFNSGTGYADDTRPWIAPDVYIAMSSEEYFSGHDPVVAAILESLEN